MMDNFIKLALLAVLAVFIMSFFTACEKKEVQADYSTIDVVDEMLLDSYTDSELIAIRTVHKIICEHCE